MMNAGWYRAVVGLSVVALLASFGLHAVQVDHVHYGTVAHEHAGVHVPHAEETVPVAGVVSLGEYSHYSEKKMLLAVAALVGVVLFYALTPTRRDFVGCSGWVPRTVARLPLRIHSYLLRCFAVGRLHPKLF